jgi:hypothetical protein
MRVPIRSLSSTAALVLVCLAAALVPACNKKNPTPEGGPCTYRTSKGTCRMASFGAGKKGNVEVVFRPVQGFQDSCAMTATLEESRFADLQTSLAGRDVPCVLETIEKGTCAPAACSVDLGDAGLAPTFLVVKAGK